eukprot:Rhum_TRINITY_DN14882_c0_g1::Rhum_TRINITY_DN14882_c0_g1_i1::g.124134::m.124134
MGCSGSKEGDKPAHHAPPTRGGAYTGTGAVQPTPAKRDVWPNGKDFPSVIQFMQIQKPDRPLEGVTLIDCLIDNARENGLVGCNISKSHLNNCHLRDCKVTDGTEVSRCLVKGGECTDSYLQAGTEASDGTKIDRCYVTDRCTVTGCVIGPTLTTTNSLFISCEGTPMPPPKASECHECNWTA